MQSGQKNRRGRNPYQDRATPKPGTKKFGNNKAMGFDWSKLGLSADVVEDLETAARHSLATKTWSSYKTAENLLIKFHKEEKLKFELPVSEVKLMGFVHWLAFKKGKKSSTVNSYLAGIRKLHTLRGMEAPNMRSEFMSMVLKGKSNMEAAERLVSATQERQPVTPDVLELIKIRLKAWSAQEADKQTIWTVCTLLFHGAFRGGELLCRRAGEFDPAFDLLRRDVLLVDEKDQKGKMTVQIKVKAPKESKDNRAVIVDIYQSDSVICPVRACKKWWAASAGAEADQPAFNGNPVTIRYLNGVLKERLEGVLEGYRITSHSFRGGAASMMATLGFSEKDIKAAGRWSSSAVEKYIKLPRSKRIMVAGKVQKYLVKK